MRSRRRHDPNREEDHCFLAKNGSGRRCGDYDFEVANCDLKYMIKKKRSAVRRKSSLQVISPVAVEPRYLPCDNRE
jgi:hypothetical protein